jgi:hypothetical protein
MYIPVHLKRIVLFSEYVDFRKHFCGLLSLCYTHGYDPYNGDCVIFVRKNKRQIRVIVGDPIGLYLICRKYEGGALKGLFEKKFITTSELAFIFQGTVAKIHSQVTQWKKSNVLLE